MVAPALWPLSLTLGVFLLAALVVAVAGSRLATTADRLAARTGMGQAIFGALFLGGTTSLSGIVTSITAASAGHPELAVSNALGSIAAQTAFLGLADFAHRKANLEHSAASAEILMQGALLITLLSIPLLAMAGPAISILTSHPASLIIVGGYIFGLYMVFESRTTPMWRPRYTQETWVEGSDTSSEASEIGLARLWLAFGMLSLLVGFGGYVLAKTGIAISIQTGLSETVVGGLFTAIVTSFAEAVTTIAAVRRGALTLGVSNIIGGNCFDVTVVAFSDVAYAGGSIYHTFGRNQIFLVSLTIILTGILLLGLLRREKHGIANIGLESFLILVIYLFSFFWLADLSWGW